MFCFRSTYALMSLERNVAGTAVRAADSAGLRLFVLILFVGVLFPRQFSVPHHASQFSGKFVRVEGAREVVLAVLDNVLDRLRLVEKRRSEQLSERRWRTCSRYCFLLLFAGRSFRSCSWSRFWSGPLCRSSTPLHLAGLLPSLLAQENLQQAQLNGLRFESIQR